MSSPESKPNSTLSTGKYTIDMDEQGCKVYSFDENNDKKQWVCSTWDIELAMNIIEGLILVEHKRFYHPGSKPKIEVASTPTSPSPPFLKRDGVKKEEPNIPMLKLQESKL